MPGGDRAGPRGLGPMTGRGLGSCRGAWEGGVPGGGFWPPVLSAMVMVMVMAGAEAGDTATMQQDFPAGPGEVGAGLEG